VPRLPISSDKTASAPCADVHSNGICSTTNPPQQHLRISCSKPSEGGPGRRTGGLAASGGDAGPAPMSFRGAGYAVGRQSPHGNSQKPPSQQQQQQQQQQQHYGHAHQQSAQAQQQLMQQHMQQSLGRSPHAQMMTKQRSPPHSPYSPYTR
jgi:hypothetical protein